VNIVTDHLSLPFALWTKGKLSRCFLPMTPKAPRFPPNGSRVVEVLAYPSVKLLDVSGPIQVFASANAFMTQAREAMPYAIRIVAQGGERIEASAGVELPAHPLSPVDAALDTKANTSPWPRPITLVIAGGDGVNAAAADRSLVGLTSS
jgi:transcriptional regulator GlxA family with amidase domain